MLQAHTSVSRAMFHEYVAMRTEKGLGEAIAQAAQSQRTSPSEFMRQAIRKAILANGVSLPPFPGQYLGRKPR